MFISPSSYSLWKRDRQEWYLKYKSKNKPPRLKQTEPMSVGSAFDAFVKAYLKAKFCGGDEKDLFTEYFETQVEEHNRDFALKAGRHCFDVYNSSGALVNLLSMMKNMEEEPQFEFTLRGKIEDIPLMGKPDMYVKLPETTVLLDWKVNGYCSKSNTSPKARYIACRSEDGTIKNHKDTLCMMHKGVMVGGPMEQVDIDWANQLSIYGWLLGEQVGSSFICAIDQLVRGPKGLRVANFRGMLGSKMQLDLFVDLAKMHKAIENEHYFDDESVEESKKRCDILDLGYTSKGDWIDDVSGRGDNSW